MILIDDRWFGPHGIGRFAYEVCSRIEGYESISHAVPHLHALDPVWQSVEILRKKPEVYFNPGYNPPLFSSIPFVFTIHDLNHIHNFGNNGPLKNIFYEKLIKPACSKAYKVLTVSEFSKNEIIQWSHIPEDRVVNVGNAANDNFSITGKKYQPGFSYMLYIGNHKPHKNLERLIDAFSIFLKSKNTKKVKLLITGKEDVNLSKLISKLDVTQSIKFTGLIRDDKLPEYYRGALACVLPSLYEGFGLPIVEAMSCGAPVITSNVSAMPEIAGGAAYLVDPLDVMNMYRAITEVINNQKLRYALSSKGLKRAKAFSWDVTANKVSEILNKAK